MFLLVGGGPLFAIIVMFMLRRQYGWGAVLWGALAFFCATVAFYACWLLETRILAIWAVSFAAIAAAFAGLAGHSYLPNRARRIVERQNRADEWQWAENIVGTRPMPPRYNSAQEDWAAYAQRDAAKEAKLRIEPTFRSRRFT
jgi:hypothetical protein